MAGVKVVTPGFAFECFGFLIRDAKERNARVYFDCVKPELRPVLLQSVKAALIL